MAEIAAPGKPLPARLASLEENGKHWVASTGKSALGFQKKPSGPAFPSGVRQFHLPHHSRQGARATPGVKCPVC